MLCKSLFLPHQLSVFSVPVNYEVVKIAHFSSEIVLRTMKHTMIYLSSVPSFEVIVIHPMI
jgi:hypothetical protein